MQDPTRTLEANARLHAMLTDIARQAKYMGKPRTVELIGPEKVEWLEGPHQPNKYTIDDLKAIKAEYIKKRKEIEACLTQ